MGRLPILTLDQMSDHQKDIHERIAGGKRGGFRGPFNVWIYRPEYLDRQERVGEYVRYLSLLPPRLSEFAILITARHWTAQYAWFAHEPHAVKGGLAQEIIDAVRERRRPVNMQPDEEAVYDFTTELHENQAVSDASYQKAVAQFTEEGVVDLAVLVGHYTTVAMTLKSFEVPIPGDAPLPLPV